MCARLSQSSCLSMRRPGVEPLDRKSSAVTTTLPTTRCKTTTIENKTRWRRPPLQVHNIFVFIRQVAPIPACWLFKTPATSWPLSDLLTLKVVSESRATCSVPILVFLGLSVLELGPMYATDVRQTDARQKRRLTPPGAEATGNTRRP